jgi:Trypsin-like peptidase domain
MKSIGPAQALNIEPNCVIKVGQGRGFVIAHRRKLRPMHNLPGLRRRAFVEDRLVITAAHCLPKFPRAFAAEHCELRTYPNLLGSLANNKNGKKNDVWAECLFADPIADIAVLGCPDGQALSDEADAYNALTEKVTPLRIGAARSGKGWLLSLDRPRWIRTVIDREYGSLHTGPTKGGMSGSPILNDRGQAVGILCTGTETIIASSGERVNENAGPHAILTENLPGWLLQR